MSTTITSGMKLNKLLLIGGGALLLAHLTRASSSVQGAVPAIAQAPPYQPIPTSYSQPMVIDAQTSVPSNYTTRTDSGEIINVGITGVTQSEPNTFGTMGAGPGGVTSFWTQNLTPVTSGPAPFLSQSVDVAGATSFIQQNLTSVQANIAKLTNILATGGSYHGYTDVARIQGVLNRALEAEQKYLGQLSGALPL